MMVIKMFKWTIQVFMCRGPDIMMAIKMIKWPVALVKDM